MDLSVIPYIFQSVLYCDILQNMFCFQTSGALLFGSILFSLAITLSDTNSTDIPENARKIRDEWGYGECNIPGILIGHLYLQESF